MSKRTKSMSTAPQLLGQLIGSVSGILVATVVFIIAAVNGAALRTTVTRSLVCGVVAGWITQIGARWVWSSILAHWRENIESNRRRGTST